MTTQDTQSIDIQQVPVTPEPNKKQRAAARRASQQQANSLVSSILHTTPTGVKTTLSDIPFNTAPSPEIVRQNLAKQQSREYANVTHAAEGLLVIINNEDNTVTYGFEDLKVWVPRTQTWDLLTADDPDKFMVTAETHALASSEFYNRWRTFTQRAYKTRIFITAINR